MIIMIYYYIPMIYSYIPNIDIPRAMGKKRDNTGDFHGNIHVKLCFFFRVYELVMG